MPWIRLQKLEELASRLEEIIVVMQQVADFRQQKADLRYEELKNITTALEQQSDNSIDANKKINEALTNIHIKLHTLSNQIMALVNNTEELAEYASLLEDNQNKLKQRLKIPEDD